MVTLVVLEAVAIGLLGLLVAGLLRNQAEILRALHELGAGVDPDADRRRSDRVVGISSRRPTEGNSTAYDVTGATLDDDVAALAILGSPQDTLLAFLSSGCGTCAGFWTAFRAHQLTVPGGARLVIVTKGPDQESVRRLREVAPREVTLVMSSEAWADYSVPTAPYFIYVDGAGGRVVGEGAAASWPQVESLLRQAIDDAGISVDNVSASRAPSAATDRDRAARTERELLAAGIGPGHPSLYAVPEAQDPGRQP